MFDKDKIVEKGQKYINTEIRQEIILPFNVFLLLPRKSDKTGNAGHFDVFCSNLLVNVNWHFQQNNLISKSNLQYFR